MQMFKNVQLIRFGGSRLFDSKREFSPGGSTFTRTAKYLHTKSSNYKGKVTAVR